VRCCGLQCPSNLLGFFLVSREAMAVIPRIWTLNSVRLPFYLTSVTVYISVVIVQMVIL